MLTNAAKVLISAPKITVGPGQTAEVVVTINPPTGVNASSLPIFSGFIQISSKTENLHVSYLGLAGALKDQQVVDPTTFFFGVPTPVLLNSYGNVQTLPTNYSFNGQDFPSLLFR